MQMMEQILTEMVTRQASDLYLTVGCPPSFRVEEVIQYQESTALTEDDMRAFLHEVLDEKKRKEFEETLELNLAIHWHSHSRFRINVFKQQHFTGMVIRRIRADVPTVEALRLPDIYAQLAMRKKGLVLIASPSGSGKSTSLAAMIGHRNRNGSGHILTVEDPIEFVHEHRGCIITQREIGIDTTSYSAALKNALRQRADVVIIGEIRDRDTMEHAMNFAETGHLCIATLHANNANQAIERITNFFPEEYHRQVLNTLSQHIEAVVSQRLVPNNEGGRTLAIEIMLNAGLIRTLIADNRIVEIKEQMEKQAQQGMQTFDMELFRLYQEGVISEEAALSEADNASNLKLRIRQQSPTNRMVFGKKPSEF